MTADHVSLHVWRVPRRAVGSAMLRMAFAGKYLRNVRFGKFLGTSTAFGPGSTDLTRWAAVTVSDSPVRFPVWEAIAESRARVDLEPLVSRGAWSGQNPFITAGSATRRKTDGMVLALTRARLRPSRALRFWNAVPDVARELAAAPGLLARMGVGEAPIGWQGTVSVWRSTTDLTAFAYRQPRHRTVIERTPTDRWYAEELFARFAVQEISGDRTILGWREG